MYRLTLYILYMHAYICKDTHSETHTERGYWVHSPEKKKLPHWSHEKATYRMRSRQTGRGEGVEKDIMSHERVCVTHIYFHVS